MVKASKIVSLAAVLLLVIVAITLSPANVARATVCAPDVWVATTGDDGNPGTQAEPFATIQKGIDMACEGGTVHVAAGNYYENLNISGAVNLTGAGAQNTIIDGGCSNRVMRISSAPNTVNVITGFTIQNGCYWSRLRNPADEQVLYAGINLDFIKTVPRIFGIGWVGGGIYIGGTHIVTLNDCIIKDNHVDDYGGGIYNSGQLYMNRCTVSGNSAAWAGGGIYNTPGGPGDSGQMWLTNCTISGNTIISSANGTHGVGIANGLADMTLTNCTIANNTTTDPDCHGGGFYNDGTATFKNTIVANNVAGTGNNGYNNLGTITSQGYNLDSENSCGFNQPTDLVNTDPLLGPLQDNGGPTFTHALLHNSPAIDSGGDPLIITDQRGVPRPQGPAFDIGAYELTQDSVATATGTGTASFSTLNGYITDLTALDELQADCGPSPDLDFSFGLFSFTVTDITPGSSVTVVIILPSNAPTSTQYWKCLNGQWVDCTSLLGSNDGDSVLTLTITDGGLGDGDGQANGEISDPGGPSRVLPTPAGPGVSPTIPRQLKPSQISLQYLSISPQQANANQPINITTNVVNTGDEAGNYNVTLKINGQVEQSRMVSVGPQASQPVKFTVTKAQPGTYNVNILDKSGSFTILSAGSNTPSSSGNSGLIILLIIGVLVLATVLVLILSRRPA